ncbi:hypothetical protein D9Q98_003022 [Chlorella vulgaris]|uniref:Mitochondrial carrier protein n=1 Tax=Chlorella vulgaris TaxID=3077 RepID=A0A9D4TVU1_CHLVU|nr:hypothetical protein D9Q98_003022 [Chlorella vulgaris]
MPLLSLMPQQLYVSQATSDAWAAQRAATLQGHTPLPAPALTSPYTPSANRSLMPAAQQPVTSAAAPAAARSGLPAVPNLVPAVAYSSKEKEPLSETLKRAGKRALGGGIPGAAAMGLQVLSLMWLRTTVNYQYRYGTTTTEALKHLYKEGGVVRFYRGLAPALLQGPLSRFGDTAANAGMLSLLEEVDMPVALKTMAASGAAAAFRILLMPIDATKTIMQVEGKGGFQKLAAKVKVGGPGVLYHGALAASAATFVGHYPWFAVYNYLNHTMTQYDDLPKRLLRSAFIGFCASAISDTCSNSIRVVKTTKQTATVPLTYPAAIKMVVEKDGVLGLFGRGLKTKIISNGMQGLLFSVLWRMGQDYMAKGN